MIGRIWSGLVAAGDVEEYVAYVEDTGVAEYGRSRGCRLASTMTRALGEGRAEVVAFSVWESEGDLRGFTGSDIDTMQLYPRDEAFLQGRPTLTHLDVRSLSLGPAAERSDRSESLARAFSGHRFAETFDHLAHDVRWIQVGQSVVQGREAVIDICQDTLAELAEVATTWSRFVIAASEGVVAVDTVGRYDSPDGVTAVSSCDIYEFRHGKIATISSYTVEVDPDNVAAPPAADDDRGR